MILNETQNAIRDAVRAYAQEQLRPRSAAFEAAKGYPDSLFEELAGLVSGRGACAHPDGTARLVASLLRWFGDELRLHQRQECGHGTLAPTR